jgi:hypothetical protein
LEDSGLFSLLSFQFEAIIGKKCLAVDIDQAMTNFLTHFMRQVVTVLLSKSIKVLLITVSSRLECNMVVV